MALEKSMRGEVPGGNNDGVVGTGKFENHGENFASNRKISSVEWHAFVPWGTHIFILCQSSWHVCRGAHTFNLCRASGKV